MARGWGGRRPGGGAGRRGRARACAYTEAPATWPYGLLAGRRGLGNPLGTRLEFTGGLETQAPSALAKKLYSLVPAPQVLVLCAERECDVEQGLRLRAGLGQKPDSQKGSLRKNFGVLELFCILLVVVVKRVTARVKQIGLYTAGGGGGFYYMNV